jgi:hypothetical protein
VHSYFTFNVIISLHLYTLLQLLQSAMGLPISPSDAPLSVITATNERRQSQSQDTTDATTDISGAGGINLNSPA